MQPYLFTIPLQITVKTLPKSDGDVKIEKCPRKWDQKLIMAALDIAVNNNYFEIYVIFEYTPDLIERYIVQHASCQSCSMRHGRTNLRKDRTDNEQMTTEKRQKLSSLIFTNRKKKTKIAFVWRIWKNSAHFRLNSGPQTFRFFAFCLCIVCADVDASTWMRAYPALTQ